MKVVNFTILSLKSFWKTITLNCIQLVMKENLLLLKDLIKPWKIRFINTCQLCQKNFDVLGDIVDKYNKTFLRTIKTKPIDVKSDSYVQYNVDSNEKIGV